MRITEITVVLHERRHTASASFGPARPVPLGVLRIQTDEGIEGNAFLSNPGPGPAQIAEQIVTVVKPWLLGEDPLDTSGPITLSALTGGKVQAADVFTTTPQIVSDKLVSLADPKFNFAAQNVIPLVYKPAMNSTVTDTLNAISAKLTTAALLQMDNAVITDKANYTTVAQGFLQSIGMG